MMVTYELSNDELLEAVVMYIKQHKSLALSPNATLFVKLLVDPPSNIATVTLSDKKQ